MIGVIIDVQNTLEEPLTDALDLDACGSLLILSSLGIFALAYATQVSDEMCMLDNSTKRSSYDGIRV